MADKHCSKCKETKPLESFYRDSTKRDGRRVYCKDCADKTNKKYYENNKDAVAAYKHSFYLSKADEYKRVAREVYYANPGRWKNSSVEWIKRNPEKRKQAVKRWKENNRDAVCADAARRRAIKNRACPPWADLDEIASFYEEAAKSGLHVDHIVPLRSKKVCGLHVPSNLQLLPPEENIKKNNRWWPDMP